MFFVVTAAFGVGLACGILPRLSVRNRLALGAGTVLGVFLWAALWAISGFGTIPPWSLTHGNIHRASGALLRVNDDRSHVDGWNQPFQYRFKAERDVNLEQGGGDIRHVPTLEVRSLGANNVEDFDDQWVQFEIIQADGVVKLVSRRSHGLSILREEPWIFENP